MSQSHLEIFPSEYHMLKFFGQYLPKLDVDTSARLAPFLYSYDGQLVLSRNVYDFLTQIEEMTALGINVRASAQKGTAFLVFFDQPLKDAAAFREAALAKEPLVENIIPLDPPVEMENVVSLTVLENTVVDPIPEVKIESNEEKVEVVEVVLSEESQKILAEAETLRDDSKKAAAKTALEAFASEKGVTLSKAKTFDGMLEDLKAALK